VPKLGNSPNDQQRLVGTLGPDVRSPPADLDLRLDTCRLVRERRPSDLRREVRGL
jgi:hypothetical protein